MFQSENTVIFETWLVSCILCYLHPAHELDTSLGLTSVVLVGRFRFKLELPDHAQQLISELLVVDPKLRLGTNSSNDVKNYPFFSDFLKLDFSELENKQVTEAVYLPFRNEKIGVSGGTFVAACYTHNRITTEFHSTSTNNNWTKTKQAGLEGIVAV